MGLYVHNAQTEVKSKCTYVPMHFAHMKFDDRPDQAKRLEQARELKGIKSAREAALRFGWKYDTYAQHENGTRGIQRSADSYAKAYGVSKAWLLTGEGSPTPAPAESNLQRVPVISRTAAGGLEYRQGIHPADIESFLTVSGLGKGDWFALVVDGDSMDRIAPDGSTIFVNRAEFEPMDGKPYIFATPDDNQTTFKLWDENGFLLPFSMNPDHRPIAIQENGVRCIGRVRNVFRTLD